MKNTPPRFVWMIAMLLFSPTRLFIDCWKRKYTAYHYPDRKAELLLCWNRGWFWGELIVATILAVSSPAMPIPVTLGCVLLAASGSRCNEIFLAFLKDANRELEKSYRTTTLKPGQRIKMAMRSYVGLLVNFGVIYYFVPKCLFKPGFESFIDAFYFSGVTLATLGYGDFVPVHPISKLLVVYEVFAGLLLVVVALAVYLSAHGQWRD